MTKTEAVDMAELGMTEDQLETRRSELANKLGTAPPPQSPITGNYAHIVARTGHQMFHEPNIHSTPEGGSDPQLQQLPSISDPDPTREAEQDRAIDRQNRKRNDADKPTPEQAQAALEAIQKRSRMTVPKLLARYQERVESLGESIRLSEEVIKEEVACQKEYEQARHFWQKAIAEIERGEA